MRVGRIGLSVMGLAAFVAGAPAGAQSPATAFERYRTLPPAVLAIAFPATAVPDANGLFYLNRTGWKLVSIQRSAATAMIGRIVAGDRAGVAAEWRAIDAAFQHQRPDGSFETAPVVEGRPPAAVNQPTDAAFFLATACQAMLLVGASPMHAAFDARVAAARPRIARTLGWLASPASQAAMRRVDSGAVNRLLVDAKALTLCGALTGDAAARSAGAALLADAFGRETPDGVLPEHGGGDTGYQAVSITQASEIALFTPQPQIRAPLARAVAWEEAHVDAGGTVSAAGNTRTGGEESYFGRVKAVSVPDVVRGLATWAAWTGDAKVLGVAGRVAAAGARR